MLQSAPQPEKGINLVEKPGKAPVFQKLLAQEPGRAVWIDTGNESSTYALAAHDPALLEKVCIGRAFTPFQHHSLVHHLEDFIGQEKRILVLSNVTGLYDDGQVSDWEAEELFKESWDKVKRVQEDKGLKVLVSTSGSTFLDALVESDADAQIRVKETSQGLRYEKEGFEQMGYNRGGVVQTTFSCWKDSKTDKVAVKAEKV